MTHLNLVPVFMNQVNMIYLDSNVLFPTLNKTIHCLDFNEFHFEQQPGHLPTSQSSPLTASFIPLASVSVDADCLAQAITLGYENANRNSDETLVPYDANTKMGVPQDTIK